MQAAVPLAALNGSTHMSAFKSPSLSPPSAELSLRQMAGNPVYEISATTSTPVSAIDTLTDIDGKCNLGDEMASYTTQYYSTVETQSRASSPSSTASPRDSAGNISPVSVSSKESSSPESLSPLDGEGSEGTSHQSMCVPNTSSEMQTQKEQKSGTQVKHWTYEDQFKQLYNLSQEAERKEYLDKLFDYMQKKGTPITRIPIMAKQPLDLYKLFKLVVDRGGLVEVIKKKAWRNVAKELNLPASITSAAFTMRSQYVKYLYPYECETEKLSDPQELQMAIESNKRDRRHSENMDFITQQMPRDMDPSLSPAVTTTAPQGLQLINSTTMALPHASLPPYSGGFIVTGGPAGAQVVASPQLVQMTPHVPAGIPIVMSSPTVSTPLPAPLSNNHSYCSSEDRDDVQSHGSGDGSELPPAKRPALENTTHMKVTMGNNKGPFSLHQTSAGNIIMTHGAMGGSPAPQHLIQMGPQGQIPIVLPTTPVSTVREHHAPHLNGKTEADTKGPESGPITVSHLPSHHGNLLISQRSSSSTPSTYPAHNLFQMAPHPNIPGLIIPQPLPTTPSSSKEGDERRKAVIEQEKAAGTSSPAVAKMPFANISVQPAGGKLEGEHNGSDASLLVTLEINNTMYQGVLFAKPHSVSSPQR